MAFAIGDIAFNSGAILRGSNVFYAMGTRKLSMPQTVIGKNRVDYGFEHGGIPLSPNLALAFGQDLIDVGESVSYAGLAIWSLSASGAVAFKYVQSVSDARVPESGEKTICVTKIISYSESKTAFFSMGKYWFIDAIINHGGTTGNRRYIGLFDVETRIYTDLQKNSRLIDLINANSKAIFRF